MKNAKLSIQNIGLVRDANIELNGITVLTGHNNSGKSTIEKVLYSIVYSAGDLQRRYMIDRFDYMCARLDDIYFDFGAQDSVYTGDDPALKFLFDREYRHLVPFENGLLNHLTSLVNAIPSLTQEMLDCPDISGVDLRTEEDFEETKSNAVQILNSTKDRLERTTVQNFLVSRFSQVLYDEFSGQITPIKDQSANSRITFSYDNGSQFLTSVFQKDSFVSGSNTSLASLPGSVCLVDDPYVMDNVGQLYIPRRHMQRSNFHHRNVLLNMLTNFSYGGSSSTIESLENAEKLEKVFSYINDIVPGTIEADLKNRTSIYVDGKERISTINLATGVKLFSILKMLISLGIIKENGFIMLDEPEAHLHPEWINRLAMFLIALRKEMNLTILVTTQSSNLVLALDAFRRKEEITDHVNFYMSKPEENGMVSFNECTDMSKLYGDLTYSLENAFHTLKKYTDK